MADKFISFRDAASVDAAKKDTTTGRVQVVKSENALVYEGTSVIKGISDAQANYVNKQLQAEALFDLSIGLTTSPANGTEYRGGTTAVTITATIKYKGTLVDATVTAFKGQSGKIVLTKQSTGVYKGTYTLASATNGRPSVTIPVTADYTDATHGTLSKAVNVAVNLYAPIVFISSASKIESSDIQAAINANTNKYVKSSAAGTYSVPTTAGQNLYLCYPSFCGVNTIKSGGFDVPFDAATDVNSLIVDGFTGVVYKVRKKSDTPTASTGILTLVIA